MRIIIKNRKLNNIEYGIKLKITRIHSDSKFETIQVEMNNLGISLYCVSKKWHIPDIERFNQTVKERVLYTWAVMPFKLI